jgi:hypothetical protein
MVFVPVQSDNIIKIGYDASQHTMRVCFTKGAVYDYAEVPEEIFRMFCAAPSKGKFFKDQIKFRYGYKKLN